jgi:pimeloyl-ACP methyl ester carboxylesterase
LALTRPSEIRQDPHRDLLVRDLEARSFYPAFDVSALDLEMSAKGTIRGTNPYARVGDGPKEHVVASLRRAERNPRRHLVVVCHCYGVPSAPLMRRLFGIDDLDADVLCNVMGNHQHGTYLAWPGSGLVSARPSLFIENIRSAVTGLRAVVAWLDAREQYETISVLGYSIGGHLALHLAHAGDVDRALLYCPAVDIYRTAAELGVMRPLAERVYGTLAKWQGGSREPLEALASPTRLPLPIAEEDLHLVLQRFDAISPRAQMEPLRTRYPRMPVTELPGTHLVPKGLDRLHRVVRQHLGRASIRAPKPNTSTQRIQPTIR